MLIPEQAKQIASFIKLRMQFKKIRVLWEKSYRKTQHSRRIFSLLTPGGVAVLCLIIQKNHSRQIQFMYTFICAGNQLSG